MNREQGREVSCAATADLGFLLQAHHAMPVFSGKASEREVWEGLREGTLRAYVLWEMGCRIACLGVQWDRDAREALFVCLYRIGARTQGLRRDVRELVRFAVQDMDALGVTRFYAIVDSHNAQAAKLSRFYRRCFGMTRIAETLAVTKGTLKGRL